jgi:hypothetical protein
LIDVSQQHQILQLFYSPRGCQEAHKKGTTKRKYMNISDTFLLSFFRDCTSAQFGNSYHLPFVSTWAQHFHRRTLLLSMSIQTNLHVEHTPSAAALRLTGAYSPEAQMLNSFLCALNFKVCCGQ